MQRIILACAVASGLLVASHSYGTTWFDSDIGANTLAGDSTPNSNFSNFVVQGAGTGLGASSDELHFAHRDVEGSFELITRLESFTGSVNSGQAGLMVRGDLESEGVMAAVMVSKSGELLFIKRENENTTATVSTVATTTLPIWLKLEVRGTAIRAYSGTNGVNWVDTNQTATLQLPDVAQAGLAVSSQDAGSLIEASFTDTRCITNLPMLGADLRLWLKADTGVVTETNGTVSEWLDQSGNGNHAQQTTSTARPLMQSSVINGLPALNFSTSKFMSIAHNTSLTPGEVSIFAVVRRPAGNANAYGGGIVAKYTNTVNGYYLGVQQSSSDIRFNIGSGEGVASSGPWDSSFHLLNGIFDQSDIALFKDGQRVGVERRVAAIAYPTTSPPALLIGRRQSNTSSYFNGEVAEVLVYGVGVTDEQRRNIEAYFQSKYGLAAPPRITPPSGIYGGTQSVEIAASKNQITYYTTDGSEPTLQSAVYEGPISVTQSTEVRAISIMQTGDAQAVSKAEIVLDPQVANLPSQGKVLWLRADQGVEIDGSNRVSRWLDQSGYSNHAEQTTATYRPYFAQAEQQVWNGKPAVRFDGANSLLNSGNASSLSSNNVSVFAVVDRTAGTGLVVVAEKYKANTLGYSLRMSNATSRTFTINGTTSTATLASSAQSTLLAGTFNGSHRKFFINGTETNSDTQSATLGAVSNPLLIGGRNTSYNLAGRIAELLIYNRELSLAERQAVESYVYARYNIGSLPKAQAPTTSLASGTYSAPQNVSLSTGTLGGMVRYTTDGTEPTSASSVFTAPIPVDESTVIKARTFGPGYEDSVVTVVSIHIDPSSVRVARSGLKLWLRADQGVETDSNGVSLWMDQSGHQNNALATLGTTQPTLLGNAINSWPALKFESARSTLLRVPNNSSINPTELSLFVVAKRNPFQNSTSGVVSKYLSTSPGQGFDLRFQSTSPTLLLNVSGSSASGGASVDANYFFAGGVFGKQLPAGRNIQLYQGDIELGTTARTTNISTSSSDLLIGARQLNNGTHLDGEVAEIFLYDRPLQDWERRELLAYSNTKYQLGTPPSLPAPSLTVSGGSAPGTKLVTAICEEPGAVIRYTTNGSTPTESSPIYVQPITVYETCSFRAALFKQDFSPSATVDVLVEVIGDWQVVEIGGTSIPSVSGDPWTFETSATGPSNAGDDYHFVHKPCGRGGSIEWQSSLPTEGMCGIMIRASVDPLAASAFVGFKAGNSNCYFISRAATGLTQIDQRTIPGVQAGDQLRLEMAGNTALLSTKAAAPGSEWVKRWGIDIFNEKSGRVFGFDLLDAEHRPVEHCLMGVAAASLVSQASPASFNIDEESLVVNQTELGVKWLRVFEPYMSGPSYFGRGTMLGFETASNSTINLAIQSGKNGYASNDITVISSPGLIRYEFNYIKPLTPMDLDVYVRVEAEMMSGNVYVDCAGSTSSNNNLIDVGSGIPLGGYVKVGEIHGRNNGRVSVVVKNSNDGTNFTTSSIRLDSILLVAAESDEDLNSDGISTYAENAIQEENLNSYSFLHWADSNGNGWSDYQEVVQGIRYAWKSPVLSFETVGPYFFSPYGHWSSPINIKATYDSINGDPVVGLSVRVWSSNVGGTPTANLALAKTPNSPVHYVRGPDVVNGGVDGSDYLEGALLARTENDGRTNFVFYAPDDQTVSGHRTIWAKATDYSNPYLQVRLYDNDAPQPPEILSSQYRLSQVDQSPLENNGAVAVRGRLMAKGHPGKTLPGAPAAGYVDVLQWDEIAGQWRAAWTLLPPDSGSTQMGRRLQFANLNGVDYLIAGSSQKLHFYPIIEDQLAQTEPVQGMSLQVGSYETLDTSADRLVVGAPYAASRGQVLIYKLASSTWTLEQTLQPSGEGHSDAFGRAVEFSQNGQFLAIGAPSDVNWWYNPANEPHYEYVELPYYEMVGYDENNEEIWEITYYYYDWVWVEPPPPATPSVHVYEFDLTGGGSWQLQQTLTGPSPSSGFFGWSLAFSSDSELYVNSLGFQYYDSTSTSITYQAYLYSYALSAGSWSANRSAYSSGSPMFGAQIKVDAQGYLYALAPREWTGVDEFVPAFVTVLKATPTAWEQLHVVNADPEVDDFSGLLVDEGGVFVQSTDDTDPSAGALRQYELLPAVPATAQPGAIASITAYDREISAPPASSDSPPVLFEEKVTMLLENQSERFELSDSILDASNSSALLHLKAGENLLDLAGQVAWLQLMARDMAGDSAREALGLRILGEVPSAPSGLSAWIEGRGQVKLQWTGAAQAPAAYLIERSVWDDYYNGIEGAFSEIRRVSGLTTAIIDPYSDSIGTGYVYLLRAQNNEGTSNYSVPVVVLEDSDDDGIPDWWEILHAGNLTSMDGTSDSDGDGLTDLYEYTQETRPNQSDTDADGIPDSLDSAPQNVLLNNPQLVLHTPLQWRWN